MVSLFRARVRQYTLVAAAFSLGASGVAGCRTSCDDAVDSDPVVVDNGHTDVSGLNYESVEQTGKWLKFPPARVFEFHHHLSSTPFSIVPYVSFGACPNDHSGTCDDEGHPSKQAAVAAGDLAPISDVNEESFRVHNNTCETFWLRVVAFSADFSDAESAGGAGGVSGVGSEGAGTGGAL